MNDPIVPAERHTAYVNHFVNKGIIELKTIIGHEHLEITLDIQNFTKEQQVWLAEVIPQQIQKAYEHGFTEALHQVRSRLHEALGIKNDSI